MSNFTYENIVGRAAWRTEQRVRLARARETSQLCLRMHPSPERPSGPSKSTAAQAASESSLKSDKSYVPPAPESVTY